MTEQDRLVNIKRALADREANIAKHTPSGEPLTRDQQSVTFSASHIDWLIAEVERLRKLVKRKHMLLEQAHEEHD